MSIDYRISKIKIRSFRGIDQLDLDIENGAPLILIGSNNAGKSTVLHAMALALNGGGYHQWSPVESDFYCGKDGARADEFLVQVEFSSESELGYPAVKGVGNPALIHGVEVKGSWRAGQPFHSRRLLGADGKPVTLSSRTPLSAADKERFAGHSVGYKPVNARLDDIREHTPEVWFFQPKNIEASLYVWRSGPIAKLSRLLAQRFVTDEWVYESSGGGRRAMPETIERAHSFFRDAIEKFPFWKDVMKPRLEAIFQRYVGVQATIDLRPDIQTLNAWVAQQLEIFLATDQECAPTPLRNMGDGWQSVIRLAALEAVCEYPELAKERIVLLIEEPETHLHPHLRRKMRRVLGALSKKGWVVIYTTHAPELVSFEDAEAIARLVRHEGRVVTKIVHTNSLDEGAKLQSKIDDKGAHDFLFSTRSIFCEGRDDSFAIRAALDRHEVDYDALSISVVQCGSVTAMPSFTSIAYALGIRWCAVTDEDVMDDGSIKPQTQKSRDAMLARRQDGDVCVEWRGTLEQSLAVTSGKARPETTIQKLSDPSWETGYPDFALAISRIVNWIGVAPPASHQREI